MAEEKKFETFKVRMAFQAGYAQHKPWTSGTCQHRGIGYFHPFGQCEYYMGSDFEESKKYVFSDYFTKKFEEDICEGMGFAVYCLPDGDIYCLDSVFGTLFGGTWDDTSVASFRNDVLLNVVVGGTGRYEGAGGLLMGTAEGSGDAKNVMEDYCVPEGLLKLLEGYIKIPVKD